MKFNSNRLPVPGRQAYTVRLSQGAAVRVPAGFAADELLALLVVVQEALA